MKELQNDCTTPGQSKRLLGLGVPADSANHYYGKDGKIHNIDGEIPCSLLWADGLVPCWSVGRLIEIMQVCRTSDIHGYIAFFHDTNNLIDHIISYLEEPYWYDFSKLKEE